MSEMWTREDAQRFLGISKATIFRLLQNDPSFPKPVAVTGTRRILRWQPESIAAWVEAKSQRPAA
jgi:predicted DNA-binding transcriptional regulator AlpA